MSPSPARRYAKPVGFIAAGLLAGAVLTGTVTANAAEDSSTTDGTTAGSSDSSARNGKKDCPEKQGGSTSTAPSPSSTTVPSGFRAA